MLLLSKPSLWPVSVRLSFPAYMQPYTVPHACISCMLCMLSMQLRGAAFTDAGASREWGMVVCSLLQALVMIALQFDGCSHRLC